jgi:hypothetical protein
MLDVLEEWCWGSCKLLRMKPIVYHACVIQYHASRVSPLSSDCCHHKSISDGCTINPVATLQGAAVLGAAVEAGHYRLEAADLRDPAAVLEVLAAVRDLIVLVPATSCVLEVWVEERVCCHRSPQGYTCKYNGCWWTTNQSVANLSYFSSTLMKVVPLPFLSPKNI